jgi:hypothetical protein
MVEDDGEARQVAPLVKFNTLLHLPFHGLETRHRLCLRSFTVPPFQVPEGLMDIPLGELGDD